MSRAQAAARQRMTGTARRSQLLDVAADAVLAGDLTELTMERLAERAGVSKALPYTHFESIDHVLVSLYEREGMRLGDFIWSALEAAGPGADLVRVHIVSYFEGLERGGDVIGHLTRPGSSVAAKADTRDAGPKFSARVLHHFHGVPWDKAKILGSVVHAAVLGAGSAWRKGLGTRAELEDAAAHVLESAIVWGGGRP
jgi:AcrR family transcriptional regulator